ncbi:GNAT family N-acetyltransferase [Chloroflexota bacterium]
MRNDVKITPTSEEHIDSYHKCFDSVARERLYLARTEAPSLETLRALVKANIEDDVPHFVALVDDEVVGWCNVQLQTREGFRHRGELGTGLLRRYRRLGIGQQLVATAIQKSKTKGLERIEVEVFKSNLGAIKLYEKMGFTIEGAKKKARIIDGKYDDIVDMVLFI